MDTGWPFLIAGVLLLGATVLIPAQEDLEEARWQRDRALAVEAHRLDRVDRHERYLAALESADEGLIRTLAATQLNQIPAHHSVVIPVSRSASASVFATLEPTELKLPERTTSDSLLSRWARGERSRMWLIAAGAVLLFLGLIPASTPRPAAGAA